MSRNIPRLYVDAPLRENGALSLGRDHAHYLRDVMRLKPGDDLLVFNGRDGEWRCALSLLDRKRAGGATLEQTRPQTAATGPDLFFAPVKKTGTGFIAEKATELGVQALRPVMTEYTDTSRVNIGRLRANAIEAAEQCGRLDVPDIHEPVPLLELAETWPSSRTLVVADETGQGAGVLDVLRSIHGTAVPPAFVIGPQGGFSETELVFLRGLPVVKTVDLGPRILRAETAAVSVLTCWQAVRGDWT